MALFLGLDGGGTKTQAVLMDESRRELGRGAGGPCNIATCAPEVVAASVREAVRGVMESARLTGVPKLEAVCAAVAGFTAKGRRAEFGGFLESQFPGAKCRVEPDYVAAYWGASEGAPGVVVIAGTGSVVYGRNEQGVCTRVGGRGFLLGDSGSGFSMGLGALGAALRCRDGRRRPNGPDRKSHRRFVKRVLDKIGAEDQEDLVEWVYRDFTPQRIASLAPSVGAWADNGDEIAIQLLQLAGRDLAAAARQAVEDLGMNAGRTWFWLAGGLWDISQRLEVAFKEKGKNAIWDCTVHTTKPLHDSAYGAALLALTEP